MLLAQVNDTTGIVILFGIIGAMCAVLLLLIVTAHFSGKNTKCQNITPPKTEYKPHATMIDFNGINERAKKPKPIIPVNHTEEEALTKINEEEAAYFNSGCQDEYIDTAIVPQKLPPQISYSDNSKKDKFIFSPELTEKLREIESALSNSNVAFITGPAGTGKSTLIKRISYHFPGIVMLAPTGIAALNISGQTIHSFFKISRRDDMWDAAAIRSFVNHKTCDERYVDMITDKIRNGIIIDEISMVRADMLDLVSEILKAITHIDLPFGGVTVLMVGDFLQLPPILRRNSDWDFNQYRGTHAIYSKSWVNVGVIQMNKVYRTHDESFIKILHGIRVGRFDDRISPFSIIPHDKNGSSVILTAKKDVALNYNTAMLDSVPNDLQIINADLTGNYIGNSPRARSMCDSVPAPLVLHFKISARVVLLINDPDGSFVNGTTGFVVDFDEDYNQWIDIITDSGKSIRIKPHTWTHVSHEQDDNGYYHEVVSTFTQFPINLAWALTIHKAQGMTIDNIYLDLKDSWEHGQVYVAMSRARSMNGVALRHKLHQNHIKANQEIVKWYENGCTLTNRDEIRFSIS